MVFHVDICHNPSGVVRTYVMQDPWEYGDAPLDESAVEYLWRDGNLSCDCNRSFFFLKAGGAEIPPCGACGEEEFSVRVVNATTGEVLFDEMAANSSPCR